MADCGQACSQFGNSSLGQKGQLPSVAAADFVERLLGNHKELWKTRGRSAVHNRDESEEMLAEALLQ